MADERNRPPSGKPDTAALIQRLFRDEPEEPRPAEETPPTPPEAGSPVGVLTPPDQAGAEAEGSGVAIAETAARDGRSWFVIHTYSGYENKVRTNLERRVASMMMENKIFRVLVPTEDEIEVKDGKRRIAKKKVFPGYVLVEMIMDDDSPGSYETRWRTPPMKASKGSSRWAAESARTP